MRRSFLPLLGLYLSLAAGCGYPWKRENIYARENVFLYRERELREEQTVEQGFAHPARVSAGELEFLLGQLRHDDKPLFGSAEEKPVFQGDEAERLAEPLSLALGTVGPDERVRFLVTRRSLASVVTGVTGVSGVVFRKPEDTLHIAFGAIGEGVNEGEGGRPEDVTFPREPTEKEYSYGLVPPLPASRLHRDPETGELRRRWLEGDLESLTESMLAARERESAAPAPAASPAGGSGREESTPGGEGAAGSPEGAEGVAGAPQPESTDRRAAEIQKKLEILEKLRESGTITEEEYGERRKQILDEL